MIENSKDALHYIKILVNGNISTQAARTTRRFILAYGDPVDYNIVDYNIVTDQVLCIDWDWNYRVKIKYDVSIDLFDDANAEMLWIESATMDGSPVFTMHWRKQRP